MTDALAGTVDLGMFSREITQFEKDKGVWWVGLCKNAVLPTISADHPYLEQLRQQGMSKDEFRAVFIEKSITTWGEILDNVAPLDIQVYTRSDAFGAAETWAKYLDGKQVEHPDLINKGSVISYSVKAIQSPSLRSGALTE